MVAHWGQDFTSATENLSRSCGIYKTTHVDVDNLGAPKNKIASLKYSFVILSNLILIFIFLF